MQAFAKRLKNARMNAGKTQLEMSEILGVERAAYTAYELGKRKPAIDKLGIIAKALDVSTDFLLGLDETPEETKRFDDVDASTRVYGHRVAQAREAAGMSCEDAAAALGIDVAEYMAIESGDEKGVLKFKEMAKLFGVDEIWLLLGTDQRQAGKTTAEKRTHRDNEQKSKLLLAGRNGATLEKDLTEEQFAALTEAISKLPQNNDPDL